MIVLTGVSGGVDSSYLILMAKKWGLRPLIVHFDNGWNTEIAVKISTISSGIPGLTFIPLSSTGKNSGIFSCLT